MERKLYRRFLDHCDTSSSFYSQKKEILSHSHTHARIHDPLSFALKIYIVDIRNTMITRSRVFVYYIYGTRTPLPFLYLPVSVSLSLGYRTYVYTYLYIYKSIIYIRGLGSIRRRRRDVLLSFVLCIIFIYKYFLECVYGICSQRRCADFRGLRYKVYIDVCVYIYFGV